MIRDLNHRPDVSTWLYPVAVIFGVFASVESFRPVLLGLAVGAVAIVAYRRGRWLVTVLAVAFFVRLVAIAIDAQLGFVVETNTTLENHETIVRFTESLLDGELSLTTSGRRNLLALLHFPFYLLLGPVQYAGMASTALYGTLIGLPVYYLASRLTTHRRSLLATGAVVFWPSIVYRSLAIQREVILVLALLVLLTVAVRWAERIRLTGLFFAVPAAAITIVFRPENLVLIVLMAALAMFARERISVASMVIGGACGAILAVFVLQFGDFTGFGTSLTPQTLDAYAHGRAHGNAAYLVDLHYTSWLDVVLLAPLKIVYFLFSPLPWQVDRLVDLLAGISGWAVFGTLLLLPRAIRRVSDERATVLILLGYALIGVALYAIVEMNYGAAFRRRIAFVPIFVLFAVVGLEQVSVRPLFPAPRETQVSTGAPAEE